MSTLVIHGLATAPKITVSVDAEISKRAALENARAVAKVESVEELRTCVEATRRLKELEKIVEESRKAIKAPVLALGKDIDSAAQTFVTDIERESARLSRLAGAYQAEEQRKAREAEAARQREMERIERERLEAERKAKEEAAAKAKSALTLEDLERLEEEREAREVEAKRKADEAAVAATITAPAPTKVAGVATVTVVKFEVVNIEDLYSDRPDLVELVPKRAAINEAIKSNRKIPGLRVWEETQARVR